MKNLDPISMQFLGVINESKELCGMSNTELARRIGLSDTSVGKKLRGEIDLSGVELLKITYIFGIDTMDYFLVSTDDLPKQVRPFRKRR